jgi:hypothetical protein
MLVVRRRSTMGEPGLSRRTLLRGAGVATGATLLGGVTAAAAAQGDESPPGVATVQQPGQPNPGLFLQALPARNPAYQYRGLAWHHFSPLANPMPGVTFSGSAGMQATGAATFYCPLDLPHGAVVREVAFECYNAHPSTGLSLGFTRTDPGTGSLGGAFAFTTTNAGKHTIVITSLQPYGTIDNGAFAYGLSAFLQAGAFGFFGARVAWSNGLVLSQLSPQARKLDTRDPGPLTGKIVTGQTKTLALTPELIVGAKSALVNLTITNTEGSGFLGLFPSGTSWPGTSSINWSGPNQIVANSATVAVSPGGSLDIFCGGGGRTHVVVDLLGYYT